MNFLNKLFRKEAAPDQKRLKPIAKPSVIVERQDGERIYFVDSKYILQKCDQGFLIRSLSGAPEYYMVIGRLISQEEVDALKKGEEIENGEISAMFRIPFEKVSFFMRNSGEYCFDGEVRYYFDKDLQGKWDSSQTGTK